MVLYMLSIPGNGNSNCNSTDFNCATEGEQFIPMSWVCDGDADCTDGRDEYDCGCIEDCGGCGGHFTSPEGAIYIHTCDVCRGMVKGVQQTQTSSLHVSSVAVTMCRIGIQLCRKLSQKQICSRSVVNLRLKVNKF